MQVDWRTPLEKIDALEKALNHWIDMDENRWFSGSTSIMLQHIDFQRFASCPERYQCKFIYYFSPFIGASNLR